MPLPGKNFFLLFLFFLFSESGFSQTGIRGTVTSTKTNEQLGGVTVIADDTNAVSADSQGKYVLPLSAGKHSIVFKLIGFAENKISEEIKPGEMKSVNITLEESATELKPIVVSAGKFEQRIEDVTVSMEVIKPSQVENKNITEMDDIIDQTPGLNVIDGQVNIRGGAGWSYGAGSRVALLVDDLPQLTADASDAKWNFLPVENLEQVEVIKGASSALFGSSALDGVINIRTAYPKSEPQTKIYFFTGFYDTDQKIIDNDTTYNLNNSGSIPLMNSGMSFFHSRQIKNLDLVIGGNVFMDNGYRRGEYEHRGRINANLRYRSKKIDGLSYGINLNTMYTDGSLFFIWKNDTTGAYLPATNTLSSYEANRTNLDPFLTYIDKHKNVHKIRTRWFHTININNTDQNSKADLYYTEYQYQKHFNNELTLTAGLVNTYSTVSSELYADHTGDNVAFYIQGDYKWKKFSFSLGGRAEQNRIDSEKDNLTPVMRAGLNYHAFSETYLRASVGQGYRFPSIAEKFVKTHVGGVGIYPNDSLEPEKSLGMEAGMRQGFRLGSWTGYLDAAAFRNEYKNMMEFTFAFWGPFDPQTFGAGFKSLNVGNTEIKGFEITLTAKGKIAGEFGAGFLAGYTYLDPQQLTYDSSYIAKVGKDNYQGSDSSNFLKYRYRHLVRADAELTFKKFSLGLSMRYNSFMQNIDKVFVTTIGSLFIPGVKHYRENHNTGDMVFDLRTSVQIFGNFKLSFICKNFFNHIYMQRPADMQPPRTFVMQVGLIF